MSSCTVLRTVPHMRNAKNPQTRHCYAFSPSNASLLCVTRPLGILVVSDFDGIGGVLMSLDLLGVTPDGIVCIEKDKVARKIVRERWPGAIHYTDIKEVGSDEVAKWAAWWPEVKLVLHTSGFPSMGGPPGGLEAEEEAALVPSLLAESIRIGRLLETVKYVTWQVVELYENVATMSLGSCKEISRLLGCQPYFFDAAECSWCRRARLYWCRNFSPFVGSDLDFTDRLQNGGIKVKVKDSGLPDLSTFLEIGATAAETEELPFLSFARPVKAA